LNILSKGQLLSRISSEVQRSLSRRPSTSKYNDKPPRLDSQSLGACGLAHAALSLAVYKR
jgi:hypothetical protein